MRLVKQVSVLISILFLLTTFASAQPGVRLWDDDVKKLVDEAKNSCDKFRDAFKKVQSVTTRTGVQVDVKQYMSDYEESFNRFKDSFDSQRTPSGDLLNVLRITNELDGFMTRNADAAGAGSEWQAHKSNVDRLARAFGTSLGDDAAPPKRMSDEQVKALMESLQEGSKLLGKDVKDAMKKDSSIDKSTRDANEQSLKLLEKKAETMKKLFNDKKPLSVEMQDFLKQMDVIKSYLTEHPLGSAVLSRWDSLENKAGQLTAEYGITS